MTTSDETVGFKTIRQLIEQREALPCIPPAERALTAHQRKVYEHIQAVGTVTSMSLADALGNTAGRAYHLLQTLLRKGAVVKHRGGGNVPDTYSAVGGK